MVVPFDVGEHVFLEGLPSVSGGKQLVVQRVAFSHTIFVEYLSGRQITVANHRILAFYSVLNLSRSRTADVSRNFPVTSFVSEPTLKVFKAKLQEYLHARPLEWHPSFWVAYVPSAHPNAFEISVNVRHRFPWAEFFEVNAATGALSRWCVGTLRDLGLLFEQPVLPLEGLAGAAKALAAAAAAAEAPAA